MSLSEERVPAVILCGGVGSRLREETEVRPKPMVEIGGQPILWHIMNIYASAGCRDFALALGYKGEVIKQYFLNFHTYTADLMVRLSTGEVQYHGNNVPDWNVTLVDTGLKTETGGRIKRLKPWIGGRTFMVTYGDGVSDIDLNALLAFHRSHGRLATVTAVRPPSRFGDLVFEDGRVIEFHEKSQAHGGWINGGFFILEPGALDYIADDSVPWELDPLRNLTKDQQLMAYQHHGFWAPMDTLREKQLLQSLWEAGKAPWKVW